MKSKVLLMYIFTLGCLVFPCLAFVGFDNTCYIIPDNSSIPVLCPNTSNPCITITQFVTSPMAYVRDTAHVDLIFLPGSHHLNSVLTMEDYYNVIYFSMIGRKSSIGITIKSEGLARLHLSEISEVWIEHINFVGFSGAKIEVIFNSLLINNCSFTEGNGTALDLQHIDKITISNSEFISNIGNIREVFQTARTNEYYSAGGALFLLGNDNVLIKSCTFTNNSADVGGVIYSTSSPESGGRNVLTIRNCSFLDNRIPITASVVDSSYNDGVVLYCEFATFCKVTIVKSNFKRNNNMMQGLALFAVRRSTVTIQYSIFDENNAGLISAEEFSKLNLWKDTFRQNVNTFHCGGLFFVSSSHLDVSSCNFVDNTQYTVNDGGGAIICAESSNITVFNSKFIRNYANSSGGVYFLDYQSSLITNQSVYDSNAADLYGGVVFAAKSSNFTAYNSVFVNNFALQSGGVFSGSGNILCILTLWSNSFINNNANISGGVIFTSYKVSIYNCSFDHNFARIGGVIESTGDVILIVSSNFTQNKAKDTGGVGAFYIITFTITQSVFRSNTANSGGAFFVKGAENGSSVSLSSFISNKVEESGAAIYGDSSKIAFHSVHFANNSAMSGAIYCQSCDFLHVKYATFSFNNGSLFTFNSKVIIEGVVEFTYSFNFHPNDVNYQGGAITCIQSDLHFNNAAIILFRRNQAKLGGAMLLSETKLHITKATVTILENHVTLTGGGIYCFQSEMIVEGLLFLIENTADNKGGAMHLVGTRVNIPISSFMSAGVIQLIANTAKEGGGIYFEGNSKLYISKERPVSSDINENRKSQFINNSANYGGAIYIADGTDSGTCSSMSSESVHSTAVECTLQVLALHEFDGEGYKLPQNFRFSNNIAHLSGSDIYGGLLDRCKASIYAEVRAKYKGSSENDFLGALYLNNISNTNKGMISSDPVKLCFCINGTQNCSLSYYTTSAKKGERITIEIAPVDQVEHHVSTVIRSYLSSETSGLGEGQLTQYVSNACGKVYYEVSSANDSEELTLYAEGPCKDLGISKKKVFISFLPCLCPIGFKEDAEKNTRCECVCDDVISSLQAKCNISINSVIRRSNFWVTYLSEQKGYLVYPECPFDYCHSSAVPVSINLNLPHGADAQCKNNRKGKLCGACQTGYSLILGSSRCLICSNYWVMLIAVFALAGMALVAFILYFNLTVAVGTINGLMFYANIVMANREIFIEDSNFLSVFISWLNLDLGIECCFYDGMDSYAKVWFRFVFPLYIIALVVIIILISEQWGKFAKLLAYKNPVATLATLILFSYTQLLRTIISSFSFAILKYPDGTRAAFWLPDANIRYFSGKHIPLLLAAMFIVIIGTVYTLILFCWQWIIQLNDIKYLKWIRNPKVYSFMDAYHAPYKFKCRYWTGLLLFARIILYLVVSIVQNMFADARINLVFTAILINGICTFRAYMKDTLYKNWIVDMLELTFYFNINIFTVTTIYIRTYGKGHQNTVANISVGIAIVIFISTVIYHFYAYCFVKLSIWKRFKELTPQMKLFQRALNHRGDIDLEECLIAAPGEVTEEKPTSTVIERLE